MSQMSLEIPQQRSEGFFWQNSQNFSASPKKSEIVSLEELAHFENAMEQEDNSKITKDETFQKLFADFGSQFTKNTFKYKISLEENFPSKLFKNRRFSLKLKLVPCAARGNKLIQNCNFFIIQAILSEFSLPSSTRMGTGSMKILVGNLPSMEKLKLKSIKEKELSKDFWSMKSAAICKNKK